jgi:hypothetical protein
VIAHPIGGRVTMTNNGKSEIMLLYFMKENGQSTEGDIDIK